MSLLDKLLGRKPKKAVKHKKIPGFFSTDAFIAPKRGKFDYKKEARKSFQRGPEDFKVVDASGQATGEKFAMDASIDEIKALNAGINESLTPSQFCWFAGQGFIGYANCAMIAQNWLVDKACSQPAKDAMRNGWECSVNGSITLPPEAFEAMRERDAAFNIKGNLIEWLHMGRVFGIRVAVPIIESSDPLFYEKPFNIDGVLPRSYKGWTQIDPYWITPELDIESASNPFDPNFYEPTWWRVNGKRFHRTHLIIFRNGRVADLLKPTYLYGAPSVPQQIAERVYAAERSANEGPMLLMTKRMTVLNVDITQAVSNPADFARRMDAWVELQSNYAVKVAGELEKISQLDTSLAEVDSTIMTQFQLVAAAARVPVTKLLGTVPKGFNSTGEYDEKSYHEELQSLQGNDALPFIQRHNILMVKSYIAPQFTNGELFPMTVTFEPVDVPTAAELATINKTKAETDSIWVNAGFIDSADGRIRISADPESGYNGIPEVVPDGPGDREHEQEVSEALLENTPAPGEPKNEKLAQAKDSRQVKEKK